MTDTIELPKQREIAVELTTEWAIRSARSDEGTVDHYVRGKIIPFGEPSVVVENGERFREQFLSGCLTRTLQQAGQFGHPRWIGLNLDHDESLDSKIGVATTIEQHDDGGYADFKLFRSKDIDKVMSILEDSHRGLSVMFSDVAPPRLVGGVRSRVQIHIHHVAATPVPTYTGAKILAMRGDSNEVVPLTDAELNSTPALDEWRAYLSTLSTSS